MKKRFVNFKNEIQRVLRDIPWIYCFIQYNRKKTHHLVVRKETSLVIEGYPRCANSFVVRYFDYGQRKLGIENYQIAHHLHASAQIKRAAILKIPSILLVRNPIDSVTSLLLRSPELNVKYALKFYISFYKNCLPYLNEVVIGFFDEFTENMDSLISKTNQKFSTKYITLTKEEEEEIKKVIIDVNKKRFNDDFWKFAVPNERKKQLSVEIKTLLSSSKYKHLVQKAEGIYQKIVEYKS